MFEGLQTWCFRNLKDLTVDLNPRLNILIGQNGQGKSNIVEALCLLATGDSFRDFEPEALIREGCNDGFIKGRLARGALTYEVVCTLRGNGRTFSVNGKKATGNTLGGLFSVVVFSPDSLNAIKQGTDQRRRLLDEMVVSFDPRKYELLARYRKVMSSRNKLLKELQDNPHHRDTLDVLDSLNGTFLELATELTWLRLEALRNIHPFFQESFRQIQGNPPDCEVGYKYLVSDNDLFHFSNREIHNSMQKRLSELRSAEIASGVSLVGPHRHEIQVLYRGKDSRFYCSQGQQRALIIALKLGQILYHKQSFGKYPVMILDDVLSELDGQKREELVRFLLSVETQVFITTTDVSLPDEFPTNNGLIMKIHDGSLTKI